MCRNIRTLAHFDPPATDAEIEAAALQFVRKISGAARPSRANAACFAAAVDEISAAARRLIDGSVASGAPRNREEWAARAKDRASRRFARSDAGAPAR